MVKKLFLLLFYTLFFIMAVLYFAPKANIYYFAEQQLQKQGIIINDEALDDKGFTFEINHATLYVKKIESAKIEKITMHFLLLYNDIQVQDVVLSDMASMFVPLHVKSLFLTYSVLHPFHVKGKSSGAFGKADIDINLAKKVLHIVLKPSKEMLLHYRNTLRNMKKDKNGGFVYEQSF